MRRKKFLIVFCGSLFVAALLAVLFAPFFVAAGLRIWMARAAHQQGDPGGLRGRLGDEPLRRAGLVTPTRFSAPRPRGDPTRSRLPPCGPDRRRRRRTDRYCPTYERVSALVSSRTTVRRAQSTSKRPTLHVQFFAALSSLSVFTQQWE